MRGGEVFRGVWRNVGGLGVSSTTGPKCLFIGQRLRAVAPLAGRCYHLQLVTSWAELSPAGRCHRLQVVSTTCIDVWC